MSRPSNALLAAIVATAACRTPATQVQVIVESELGPTRPVRMTVRVRQEATDAAVAQWSTFEASDAERLRFPSSFAIVPAAGASVTSPVTVELDAQILPTTSAPFDLTWKRTFRFSFLRGQRGTLRVVLNPRCGSIATGCTTAPASSCTVAKLCEERRLTCGDDATCVAIDVVPSPTDLDVAVVPRDVAVEPRDSALDARDAAAPVADVVVPVDAACVPRCDGRACGDDGCGGTCGACPTRQNSSAECELAQGRCTYSCSTGFADCDSEPLNGCETDTTSSPLHCGSCLNACPSSGGTPVCRSSTCASAVCSAGRGDCDGIAANGCETDTATDVNHCGVCGRSCSFANAAATCAAGACSLTACATGFANCDGNNGNGCETDTRTALASCGACANNCASLPVPPFGSYRCADSRCELGCPAGFRACMGRCIPDRACGGVCVAPTLSCAPTDYDSCGLCCPLDHWLDGGLCCHYTERNLGGFCGP